MVVPGRVQGQLAPEFTGLCGDHADVEVLAEEQDVGSGVGSSDADVVELAVVAEGDNAGVVDPVSADAVVGVGAGAGGGGPGAGGVGRGGDPAAQGAVRGAVVVLVGRCRAESGVGRWWPVGGVGRRATS